MSIISVGKRIGDLDIRLGIPPSKPQFSTREANRRISANNASSNANSVYNVFRSGMTTAGGFARPTQFLVTIDGPKGMLADHQIYSDLPARDVGARQQRSAALSLAIKNSMKYRMDLFCSNISLPGKTITDDVNETYYGPKRAIAKNVSFEEITLEYYTSINYDERLYFEAWQNSIVDPITHNVGYYDDYAKDCMITITPLTKTFTAALANFTPTGDQGKDRQQLRQSLGDSSGYSTYQVQMYECWPKTIASTPLSYDAVNQIVKTSVTFTYRNYATTAWNFLAGDRTSEYSRIDRNEYRTNTTAIQGNFLDNLPFGLGNMIGGAGRQVYETLRKNLPIGRVTGGRVFPKGLPDPKIIRDIFY
tara:strand:+ start:521 stop:1609 length:1089 start_codon:yes stop_codon:yes gene_type:complete